MQNDKKFKNVNQKKIDEILKNEVEGSMLKTIMGGVPSCSQTVAYANTTYVRSIYDRQINI